MKIYLTGQNNFGNRGCEALVRSTVAAVRAEYPDATFLLPTFDRARDRVQWPDADRSGVQFVQAPAVPLRFVNWSRVCSRLPFLTRLSWPRFNGSEPFLNDLAGCDRVLSIGGDNYSLDYDLASLAHFVAIAEAAMARGLRTVLWGASVGPFGAIPGVERFMAYHLRRLHAVTVRESHTQRYLASIGVTTNVHLVVDSAFLLQRQADAGGAWMPDVKCGILGFNMSPLVAEVRRRAGMPGDLLEESAKFVRYASDQLGLHVLLIPHVAPLDPAGKTANSDDAYLKRLLDTLGPGVSCSLVPPGLNACQLKDVIARCDYFIGARTHATIAALSSGVPTLSIAYSVKARGINLDLFGHEDTVLDTRRLSLETLVDGFSLLMTRAVELRSQLQASKPQWQRRISAGVRLLAPEARS